MPDRRAPSARRVALRALRRIDGDDAYANLALRAELDRSELDTRDRAFVTDVVYGVTRLRRRLDHAVDRFLLRPVDADVRAALRLGAYQLLELDTPAHAAVSETVSAVPAKVRGLVNAVLRKVATAPVDRWPDEATRLSYPEWIVDRLRADLGDADAVAALEEMNRPARATERPDGYVQDLASQWVAELVDVRAGDRVADVAAAPGGKATAMAEAGAWVVASDVRAGRAGLVAANAARLGLGSGRLAVLVADAAQPPYVPASFDRVLLDAPCSGLGTLRRRADARWRIDADAVERLGALQRSLLAAACDLVRPGGTLTYSVCTLTEAEGPRVAATVGWPVLAPPGAPWRPWGSGAVLLPQAAGTDGMFVARWTRPA